MAGSPAVLAIEIIADATKATRAIRGVGDQAQTTRSRFAGMGAAIGGAFAVGAVVAFGKGAVTAAEESASAIAGLETAFKNAGDTTGTAAADAAAYAGELSALIGVEDELILAAQTQLATFKNVSDETARTSGVFDRATTAAADLAAAGFGTLEGNAATLGKVLENPARGLGKLEKATGPLTDAQKELITSMTEAGDITGAQAAVLDILESKVGGTAAATATASEKMGVGFGELQEQIGTALLPTFQSLVTVFVEDLLPALSTIIKFVVKNIKWFAALAVVVLAVVAPTALVVGAIAALVIGLVMAYKKSQTFQRIVQGVFRAVSTAFGWITDAAQTVFNWIKSNWPLLLAILTGPFGLAVLAIVKNWDKIKDGVKAAIDWVKEKWNGLVDFFKGLVDTVGGVFTDIADAFKAPLNAIIGAWNRLSITFPRVEIPDWVPGIGGNGFGGNTINFPDIPTLARGGVLDRATLFVGGESGREIVTPEALLRRIMREEHGGSYTLNVYPLRADAADIAWGFRRLELTRTGR